jgi:hypothetical protein
MTDWLQRVTKWRMVFAGWQLGTRAKGDPESDAVRDHRGLSILLRAEASALTGLLIKKGVFTAEEFDAQLQDEAEYLDKSYEGRFPGFKSADNGMVMAAEAAATMAGWRP